jgi:hypothetical protein
MLFAKLLAATRSLYSARQILTSGDATAGDSFGVAVALSDDGTTIAIGDSLDDASFSNAGAAYIFTKSGSTWSQQAKIMSSDLAAGDNFGVSVGLSSDGNTLIVGADTEDTSPYTNNGAAYVFTRSGTTWSQEAKLTASDIASNEGFGRSVALSDDGNTAIIGALGEDTSPYTNNGAAYVFTRSGGTWSQQAKLTASDIQSSAFFGWSVNLSSNGNTAIVGAYNNTTSPESNDGAAYVFTRSGTTWSQQAKILPSNPESNARFGNSVALDDTGDTAAIGASSKTTGGIDVGAVYVFTRSGSTWTQQQQLAPSSSYSDRSLGWSVSISGDGTKIVSGAAQGANPGAAYLFQNISGTWRTVHRFTYGSNPSTTPSTYGTSAGISADTGAVIAIGFSSYNDGTANVGGVYVYS